MAHQRNDGTGLDIQPRLHLTSHITAQLSEESPFQTAPIGNTRLCNQTIHGRSGICNQRFATGFPFANQNPVSWAIAWILIFES